jgi:TetR/AcrR family transcriptional repressor of nem operon
VQDILKADSDAAYRFVCSLLTQAAAQGEISQEEDPALLTDYLISTYIGWHEAFILYRDSAKIKKMAQYVVKQIAR